MILRLVVRDDDPIDLMRLLLWPPSPFVEVELAVADDGMRPDFALSATFFGLGLEFEATVLFPAIGRSIDQDHFAIAFIETVEHPVGGREAPFSEDPSFGPDDLSGLEFEAGPRLLQIGRAHV